MMRGRTRPPDRLHGALLRRRLGLDVSAPRRRVAMTPTVAAPARRGAYGRRADGGSGVEAEAHADLGAAVPRHADLRGVRHLRDDRQAEADPRAVDPRREAAALI